MAHVFARSAAALAGLFLLSLAGPASATLISHISWTVTGGTFSSQNQATGPITGGVSPFFQSGGPGFETLRAHQ